MPAIQELIRSGQGVVTSFADARLRAVADAIPLESGVEVVPFGAAVARFLQWTGTPVGQLPQRGLVEAAVAQACEDLQPGSPFFASRLFPGLHRRLAATFELLRNWGIDDDRLSDIAEKCSPSTSAKLKSLARIQRDVRAVLDDLGRSFNTEHIRLSVDLSLPQDAQYPDLVVLAGSDYTPLGARWLKWISSQGVRTTVFVERALGTQPLFEEGRQLAEDLGVSPERQTGENAFLVSLFSQDPPRKPEVEVCIMSASDSLAEVEWALRDFARLREQGVEWRQMALFARDMETYGPLIHCASLNLGVPVQLARRGPILANGFARLILQVLKFLASNDVRKIGSILHSSYLGLSKAQIEDIRAAARQAYAMHDTQWQTLMEWAALHMDDLPWLKPLLDWREKALSEPASLAVWADRVKLLPENQPWLDRIPTSRSLTERDGRIHTAMQRELAHRASVRRVRKDEALTLAQFVREAEEYWSGADCSVPPSPDGVRVYSQTEALDRVEALHVLGMLEGGFPRRRSEDPILTDFERHEISGYLETRPLPDSYQEARRERDHFYRLCAATGKRLVCSYPLTDEDRDNVPAFYLEELARIAGPKLTRIDHERTQWTPPLEACLCERDRRMAEALAGERDSVSDDELIEPAAKALAKPVPGEAFTFRQLRDAYECPFRFFAHHRLKLRPPRKRGFWSNLIYLPGAAGLMKIETKEKAIAAMKLALEAEIDKAAPDMEDWEVSVLRAGGERLIHEWVEREFARRSLWQLQDQTDEEMVTFGESNTRAVLKTTSGESVPIQGTIPWLTRQREVNLGHIYRRSHFNVDPSKSLQADGSRLELGAYLAALFEKGKAAALDVETMKDRRLLFITDFEDPLSKFASDENLGLEVKPLGPPNRFFEELMDLLGRAWDTIKRARTNANPDDHCADCGLGEICRRSKEFGEEEPLFDE